MRRSPTRNAFRFAFRGKLRRSRLPFKYVSVAGGGGGPGPSSSTAPISAAAAEKRSPSDPRSRDKRRRPDYDAGDIGVRCHGDASALWVKCERAAEGLYNRPRARAIDRIYTARKKKLTVNWDFIGTTPAWSFQISKGEWTVYIYIYNFFKCNLELLIYSAIITTVCVLLLLTTDQ